MAASPEAKSSLKYIRKNLPVRSGDKKNGYKITYVTKEIFKPVRNWEKADIDVDPSQLRNTFHETMKAGEKVSVMAAAAVNDILLSVIRRSTSPRS
jgi:hypothetical protein